MRAPELNHPFAAILVLFAIFTFSQAGAFATTLDAAADFSASANPNGVWSYGSEATLGGPFVLFTTSSMSDLGGSIESWRGPSGLPGVFYNPTAAPVSFSTILIAPGQLFLHPADVGVYAVVRFTAPSLGLYSIASAFTTIDTCPCHETDVHVLLNGFSLFDDMLAGDFGVPHSFSNSSISLLAGDTIDFAVGPNAAASFDSTALGASIVTDAPATAPEPSTWLLLVLGLAWLTASRRHRQQ